MNAKHQGKGQHSAPHKAGGPQDGGPPNRTFDLLIEFFQRYKTDQNQAAGETTEANRINRKTFSWVRLYTIITGVILAATIYQAWLSNKSLVGVQRAFVSVDKIEVAKSTLKIKTSLPPTVLDVKAMWAVRPIWINDGNTPTNNLKIYLHPFVDVPMGQNDPIDPAVSFNAPPESTWRKTFLAPHHKEGFNSININGPTLKNIPDGIKTFYVWGVAKYDDVFPFTETHMTRFCYKIMSVHGDPLDAASDLSLEVQQCQTGNCTDSECEKQH